MEIKPSAEKELDRLPKDANLRVKVAFLNIQNNPFAGKKLKGKYEGFYSVRVWPYRIIYSVHKDALLIFIVKIKHRGGGAYA